MSRKVTSFLKTITQPLNLYNFQIAITGAGGLKVNELLTVVQSTSFPTEKLRKIELYANGEAVRYPSIPENDGSWKVKLPENIDGSIRRAFDELKRSVYNQKTGALTPPTRYDITVTSRDMADNLVFSVVLHDCWIQGRDQVELSASSNTESWQWDYNFVYNWLEDVDLK